MESQENRQLWLRMLVNNFSKAFERSTKEFSWKEKADLIDALLLYIPLLQTAPEEAATFYSDRIMKPFRTKMQAAAKEKLFVYFDQALALVELGIISTETFNSLPPGKQGMTDEEYAVYLGNLTHTMRVIQFGHYTFTPEEDSQTADGLHGTDENINTTIKGRRKRTHADNLTKLSNEQTALLIKYLQQGGIVLQGDYLNAKTAGLALSLLTGYNADSLRQTLKKTTNDQTEVRKNLNALHSALVNVTILIKNDLNSLSKKNEGS